MHGLPWLVKAPYCSARCFRAGCDLRAPAELNLAAELNLPDHDYLTDLYVRTWGRSNSESWKSEAQPTLVRFNIERRMQDERL